jgi:hypothetical protein
MLKVSQINGFTIDQLSGSLMHITGTQLTHRNRYRPSGFRYLLPILGYATSPPRHVLD